MKLGDKLASSILPTAGSLASAIPCAVKADYRQDQTVVVGGKMGAFSELIAQTGIEPAP
ncbi:MAG: hypothetical protein V3U65_08840 [Granulosicoccaceae bacterium]